MTLNSLNLSTDALISAHDKKLISVTDTYKSSGSSLLHAVVREYMLELNRKMPDTKLHFLYLASQKRKMRCFFPRNKNFDLSEISLLYYFSPNFNYGVLLERIEIALTSLNQTAGLKKFLFIDDLSILWRVLSHKGDRSNAFQKAYLAKLFKTFDSVFTLIHSDDEELKSIGVPKIFLESPLCLLTLEVCPLATGFSDFIDGQIKVHGNGHSSNVGRLENKNKIGLKVADLNSAAAGSVFYFKETDVGIDVFVSGSI